METLKILAAKNLAKQHALKPVREQHKHAKRSNFPVQDLSALIPAKQNDLETPYGLMISMKQSSNSKNSIKTSPTKSKKSR